MDFLTQSPKFFFYLKMFILTIYIQHEISLYFCEWNSMYTPFLAALKIKKKKGWMSGGWGAMKNEYKKAIV